MPRQLLPPVYWQNAYLDVIRWATIMENHSMSGDRIVALVMPADADVDIDSQGDLVRAEGKSGSVRSKSGGARPSFGSP